MRLFPCIWHLPLSVGDLAIVSSWPDFASATNLAAHIVSDVGWPSSLPACWRGYSDEPNVRRYAAGVIPVDCRNARVKLACEANPHMEAASTIGVTSISGFARDLDSPQPTAQEFRRSP
jgi:hypothetical protein